MLNLIFRFGNICHNLFKMYILENLLLLSFYCC